jgi:hypothetical protein
MEATVITTLLTSSITGRLMDKAFGGATVTVTLAGVKHDPAASFGSSSTLTVAATVNPAASFGSSSTLTVRLIQVQPAKTKHGFRRNWRELEYAEIAIQELYPDMPPRDLNQKKLVTDVNKWVRNNFTDVKFDDISKGTVLRALAIVQKFGDPSRIPQ